MPSMPDTCPQRLGCSGRTLSERVVNFFDGRWAAEHSAHPERRFIDPHEKPYFQPPQYAESGALRRGRIWDIRLSAPISRVSCSDLFTYEYTIKLPERASGIGPLNVFHLSDVHLLSGWHGTTERLQAAARYLEAKGGANLVFFSGDLITRSVEDLNDQAFNALSTISKLAGCSLFTLGNHDYHGHNPKEVSRWITRAGFTDISAGRVDLKIKDKRLSIIGVDDHLYGTVRVPQDVNKDDFNILLTHNLDVLSDSFSPHFDCVFSGHTHGGEAFLELFAHFMKWTGYIENRNRNLKGWGMLNDRCLSFVHPGMARYYCSLKGIRLLPGVAYHTFV
jgi:predicted MPP superfamily phosphohydrolase